MLTRRGFLEVFAGSMASLSLPVLAQRSSVLLGSKHKTLYLEGSSLQGSEGIERASATNSVEQKVIDLHQDLLWTQQPNSYPDARAYSAVVAIGCPASVFAAKALLGSSWRIVLEGSHEMEHPEWHAIETTESLAKSFISRVSEAKSARHYAELLIDKYPDHGARPLQRVEIHSTTWKGTPLASFLARPARAS